MNGMNLTKAIAILACAVFLQPALASEALPRLLKAELLDGTATAKGRATLRTSNDKLYLTLDVKGLPPGVHGVHIHTIGQCVGPDFASAGGHWNPSNHQHGKDNPVGAHAGDLPNIIVGKNGRSRLKIWFDGDLRALMDQDGAALVIHANPDDYKTDPSGASGARIACGVFKAF